MKRRSRYTPVTNGSLGLAPEVLPSTSTPPGVVASLASPADILVGVLDLPFVSAAVVMKVQAASSSLTRPERQVDNVPQHCLLGITLRESPSERQPRN